MELVVKYELDENSQECKELYINWERILETHHAPEWDYFENFAGYCIGKRYQVGDKIYRRKNGLPIGPDNCKIERHGYTIAESETIARYNATVAIWRKHYGLPPLKT